MTTLPLYDRMKTKNTRRGKVKQIEKLWLVEAKVALRGWGDRQSFYCTYEEIINKSAKELKREEVFQVRFAEHRHYKNWVYIPQWLE